MSIVSGDPDKLAGFKNSVWLARSNADGTRVGVNMYNTNVGGGCPGRAVSVPALTQLGTTLDNMADNQVWLEVIKDELIAADTGEGDVVTIDSQVVLDALAAAGASNSAPEAVDFSATTRQIAAPTSGMVDDPINASNGNMIHPEHDIMFPAIGAALNITRSWNSLLADRRGAFGNGWSSMLDVRLDVGSGGSATTDVVAHLSDGNAIGFVRAGDGWVAPSVERLTLEESADGWVLRTDHIRTFIFDSLGALSGWHVGVARVAVVRQGPREGDGTGRIIRLDEELTGRSLRVDWTSEAQVDVLTASDGRSVRYERDADGLLNRASSDAGSVTYLWSGDLLRSVVDADGVALFVNEYDDGRRVTQQTSPFGRVSSYEYRADGMTRISDTDGVVQAMRHDRFGDLTAVVDVDGTAMHLAYDDQHRVVEVVERDGATWRYRYDGDDQVERVDPDGRRLTQVWDEQHRVVEAIDRAGHVTRMEYDTDHVAPSRVIQPNGGVIHQHLDERGLPTEIIDADGVVNRFEWDSDGQLVATRDALGAATDYDYDERGYLRGIVPATGNPTVMQLGAGGRVERTTCGAATSLYEYTAAGRTQGGVEPGDVAWSATFGAHGAIASVSDAAGSTVQFEYDAIGNVTSTVAPDGAEYRQVYDAVGRLVASVDPTGATTAQVHDRRGRVVETTDPRGHTWRREVDVMSRTTVSSAPDGSVTSWSYDANGNPVTTTGPDGRAWRREYDEEGRPVAIIDPAGGRAVIEYSLAGRVVSRTSPAGRTEGFEYDSTGRLSMVIGLDGVRRVAQRDDRGRLQATVELDASGAPGRTVDYRWDDGYRLLGVTESTDGAERSTTLTRDDGGRVVESVDPTGVRTKYDWNQHGLLASATDPAAGTTTYDYDVRGRLSALTAPGGRTTEVAYGADGHSQSITDPAGVVTSMLRDAAGVVTGQRTGDGTGERTGWDRTLDALDREISRTSIDGSISGSFSYDGAGRLAEATAADSDVTIGFLFDDNDLLESVTGPDGTRSIERDADGWVTATVDPDGVRTEFQRDGVGRIIGASTEGFDPAVPGTPGSDTGNEPGSDTANDRESDRERDLAGRLTIGADGTVFRYDDAARIAEIAPLDGTPRTFSYGDDGLLVAEDGPAGRRQFHYDEAGRIVGLVTVDGVTDIGYDNAGRRDIERHPDGSATRYLWDALGRLASTERLDAEGAVSGRVEVAYDALDRPVLVDGAPVGYDVLTGLPDGERFNPAGGRAFGGVPVGGVFVIGARVLDPATHQFLSSDPLLAVPGSNGAASGYTYSWNDPVNWVDPTGMRPISIEEFEQFQLQNDKGTFAKAWDSIKEDPWGSLAMVGVTALGVGLMFVPGGQVLGAGILIGVASTSAVGLATGTFNPRAVALGGVMGMVPGGGSFGGAVALGAGSGAVETVAGSYLNGEGFPSTRQIVVGTVTGGGFAAGSRALTNIVPNGSTAATPHAPDAPNVSTPVPNQLALGPGGQTNPWPVGNNGVGMPAPSGMHIDMAMSPGQARPGGFGTLDHIPDVDFVRNNLAVRPDWKPEVSHVQTFEVPAGTRVQVGPVGPQSLDGVTYPGGANQVEILNFADRASLEPVGPPREIK